jgi:hypothetical protein
VKNNMAKPTSRNVIVGAAATFLSVADSLSTDWDSITLPARVPGTPYVRTLEANDAASAPTRKWRGTGYTSGGIEVSYNPDYGEVDVDQLLDAAKMFKQKMTATVKTTFAEATLENLAIVWAQGGSSIRSADSSATATDVTGATVDATKDFEGVAVPADEVVLGMEAGALGVEPVERQMVFIGPSPRVAPGGVNANKKRERIYHVRRVLSVEASAHSQKKNEATLFPVTFRLLPSEVSGAEYGTIRDRLIPAQG